MDDIVKVFSSITNTRQMNAFFDEIFTPAERRDLELRWQSVKMLHKGVTQRKISEQLGISLCKITRGSKVLQTKNSVSRKLLQEKFGSGSN